MSLLTGREFSTGYEFLDDFGVTELAPHTSAPWLLSDFDEHLWTIQANQKNHPNSIGEYVFGMAVF